MLVVANGKTTGFIGEDKIYIGRKNSKFSLSESPLANPFHIGKDGSRDKVIEKYRKWLFEQIKNNNRVIMNELGKLAYLHTQKKVYYLTCYCKPKSCHGDVILDCIKWLLS
jgi:hypothetical protein